MAQQLRKPMTAAAATFVPFVPTTKPEEAQSSQSSGAEPAQQPAKSTRESWEEDDASAAKPATATASTPTPDGTQEPMEEVADAIDAPPEEETELSQKFSELLSQEDNREHLNVVFIGHVDAGKSTLCGTILYLTGQVDERTIEKYKREAKEKNRESWWLAYVMDINEEEKARGKTVEVGRASFESARKRYTILDAPGHKSYVPNMIGGASQADVGILVISAKKGEFEAGFDKGGQTREHATLAKTVGIRQLVVVINKMDDPTVNWAKERYDECVDKLVPFLKAVPYNIKTEVTFLPVAGFTGHNIKDIVSKTVCPWWTGNSLFGVLDELKPLERNATAPLRMPVIDRYKERGNLSVLGKIEFGSVSKGDTILIMPTKEPAEVLELYTDTKSLQQVKAGDNVRIVLKALEEENVHSGFVLCDVKNPVACVAEFEVQMALLELPALKPVFTAGYTAVMHIHTAVEEVTVLDLLETTDKKTNSVVKRPRFVKAGAVVKARIQLQKQVCCEEFAKFQQLGRFTLRDSGKTIGIGKILSVAPRKRRKPKPTA